MTCCEITPHLNKLVKISLKNNKRKVGWLVYNHNGQIPEPPYEKVICLDVRSGRKFLANPGCPNVGIENEAESLHIDDIRSIRSSL